MKKIISSLLACLMLLSLPSLSYSKTDVALLANSFHTSESNTKVYNNDNYGLIFRTFTDSEDKFYYTYGTFNNSEDHLSIFTGYGIVWGEADDLFQYSLVAGLVTGYERSDVLPMALGTVIINDVLNIHIVPDIINNQAVFSFSIKLLEW